MKLFLLLFIFIAYKVSSQNLIYIPDTNLRSALNMDGFLTNDSLDTRKIQGRLQLDLNGKKIENIEGLQYFNQVWRLVISNNSIKHLDFLPPNLTSLLCSNNKIVIIDDLPVNLKHLACRGNEIVSIKNLPNNIISLDFSENLMQNMPQLPESIQYLNYSNNLIPTDSLTESFRNLTCENPLQNCLPFEFINWNILNTSVKDTLSKITGMSITFVSRYSWGRGRNVEKINFKLKRQKLILKNTHTERVYDKNIYPKKNDSVYVIQAKYSVDVSKIYGFIKELYSNNMIVKIDDSIKPINLHTKKNGQTISASCMDCTNYSCEYEIYRVKDTIKITYGFNSSLKYGPEINSSNELYNIKSILDWLYIYKLLNLTIEKHNITSDYFNKDNLNKVSEWAK